MDEGNGILDWTGQWWPMGRVAKRMARMKRMEEGGWRVARGVTVVWYVWFVSCESVKGTPK